MKKGFQYIVRCTLAAALFLSAAQTLSAQIVGGRQSGQGAPKEVKASELSKGGFTSDVSLFTGALSSSYSLGSVSVPGGQSFSLNMSYTGSFAGGDNAPVATGIPYGEGWNVQVPTISVSSESYYKYTEAQLSSFNASGSDNVSMAYNDAEAKDEGELYWFSPRISIPGVISENFVFKYYDLTNNESVFVPNKFSDYVEARLTNKSWRVILPNGDVYLFGITQLGIRNSSNQRVGKNTNNPTQELADDGSVLFNLVVPKEEVLTWYCTELYNPNASGGQKIAFTYEQFGQFDYYKEFMQPRLDAAMRTRLLDTIAILDSGQFIGGHQYFAAPHNDSMRITVINNTYSAFVVCKDILLTGVAALDWNGTYERIELKYKTQLPGTTQNMLDFNQAGVVRKDSLYNYAVVYSQGVEASELALLGLPAVPTGNTNFAQWWRYHHIKTTEAQTLNGNSEVQFSDPNNPYVGLHTSGTNTMFRTQGAAQQNMPFNHGFLESPRVGANLPPGDIYEVRSLIYNGNVDPLSSNGFCTFDINLVSGGTAVGNQVVANNQQLPDARAWSTNHGEMVFSTFNQAVKWNSLSNQVNSPTQQLLVTSNLFVLPNLPTQFNGFNIQIGAGNSDHDFSFDFSTNTPVGAHRAYWNERYSPVFTGNYFPNDLEPSDAIRNNFGIGLPWHMMRKVYGDMDNGDNNWNAARYNFWWKSPGDPAARTNMPTRADANVQLKALVLIRYSKNPYMLTEVNHYIVNGEVGANGNGTGEVLTSRLKFTYEVQLDTTINNRIYASNQPSEQGYVRNIFLLKKIQDLPVNSWQGNANMTVPADSLIPTTQFAYSRLVNPFFQDTTRTNADAFVLTKVTDQLGGEVSYEYYPLNDSRTPVYVRNKWRMVSIDPLANINKAPSVALQITPLVKAKIIASETDSYLPKRWEYDYVNPISRSEQIPLPNNFRSVGWNISFGFEKTILYEPQLVVNGVKVKTEVTHFTDAVSNGLLYGKVKMQEVFDEHNRVISRSETNYGVNLAFYNGINRATSYEIIPTEGEYDNYYAVTPTVYISKFDIRATSHWIPSLEGHKGTLIPTIYLHSYFVRPLKTISTEFDYTVSNPIYNIIAVLTQPNTTGHSSNLRTANPNNQNTCAVSVVRSTSVSTITEYEYWDADSFGGTQSNGYRLLLDFGGAQRKQLQFEPSWTLYRSKSYSPQHPDAWSTKEEFRYYDIKNQYGEATYDFDALYKTNLLKIRNLGYESRVVTKASGQPAITRSGYSFYDYRWNQNPDEVLDIIIDTITGSPCAGNPPPPAPQDSCVKYIGQSPPPGMVLTEINGQYYYCPGEEIPNPNRITNPTPNDPPPPIPNQGFFLAGKLYFRAQWAQVDTIPQYTDLNIDPTDAKILRFEPVVVGQTTQYMPKFPFLVLETYRVTKRNELGLVKEERDESGVVTKYWYRSVQTIWHVDVAPNGWCNSYLSRVFMARGLPFAMTVGFGRIDSIRTDVKYYINLSIDSLLQPNNSVLHYEFDNFGRLSREIYNGKLRGEYNYKYYNNSLQSSFTQRSSMNFVDAYMLLDQNSTVAEHRRSYLDPIGRNYDLISQISPNYQTNALDSVTIHKGQTDYDNWNRVVKKYKPFKETNNSQPVAFNPRFNSENTNWSQLAEQIQFESNSRGRVLKAAKCGESLIGSHTVNTSYQFITGQRLINELNLTASEITDYMSAGSPTTYRFRKEIIKDEDGKVIIVYSNLLNQVIARKAYISANQSSITLYVFDSKGMLIKTINPIKEVTRYSYNLLGFNYCKISPNSGTTKYMYNKKGQVVIEQDANGAAGTDNNSIPYYRLYTYDVYGRLLKIEKADIAGQYGALYYSNINDNTGTLIFSYATSCDFAFNYLRYLPNSQPQPIDPYSLIIPTRMEKEFGYDFAVSSSFAVLINNTLHANLQAVRNTAPQTNMHKRLSYDISYDKNGSPVQYHLYSYTDEGQIAYEMMQFNESGISIANRGICGLLRYLNYNLRGSIKSKTVDANADGSNELSYLYTYDGWNRVKEISMNGFKLVDYKYDDALNLVSQIRYFDKAVSCSTVVAVDTLIYSYDNRNRLVSFKSHLFEESLYYDAAHPQTNDTSYTVQSDQNWNGLINASKSVYKTDRVTNNPGGFDGATIYGYKYDGIKRLIHADASIMDVLTGNSAIPTPKRLYGDESLTYDEAGNILNIKRGAYYNPNVSNPANWVTNWDYVYQINTSKLLRIDSNTAAIRNYSYDANGSVRSDSYRNMAISHIDRANLISEVTVNGETLKNLYSVIDQRILKENLNTGEKTFYWQSSLGEMVGVLNQLNNNWQLGTWEFNAGIAKLSGGDLHYQIKDHLGNNRVVYTSDVNCLTGAVTYSLDNIIDYYAFGKTLREYVNQRERFQYNGKERDQETSLDYFGARYYDANVGRFLSVDPQEAKYASQSTYVFAANNPVCLIDFNGEGVNPDGSYTVEAGDNPSTIARKNNVSLEQLALDNPHIFKNYDPNNANYWKWENRANWHINAGMNLNINLPVYRISIATPTIYANAALALSVHPEWSILTYNGAGNPLTNDNRKASGCGARNGCSSTTNGIFQCEEFPPASTKEGGRPAFICCVPAGEQYIQGSQLGGMYVSNKMVEGSKFRVVLDVVKPVPMPELKPVPNPSNKPKPVPVVPTPQTYLPPSPPPINWNNPSWGSTKGQVIFATVIIGGAIIIIVTDGGALLAL